ncbi:MAG: hypothetical protein V4649_01100 [Bacteroidota bacterium]
MGIASNGSNQITAVKALYRGQWYVGLTCLGMLLGMVATAILFSVYDLRPIIIIPLMFIVPATIGCLGFTLFGRNWLLWAYSSVTDIGELKHGQWLSGFGGWQIDKMIKKYPDRYREIALRLQEYKFVDDLTIGPETMVENRTVYQRYQFYHLIFLFVLCCALAVSDQIERLMWVVFLVVITMVIAREYYKCSRLYPRITLTSDTITLNDKEYHWKYIADVSFHRDDNGTDLLFRYHGEWVSFEIDRLNIAATRLHHLLYVYEQRHEQKKHGAVLQTANYPTAD